MTTKLYTAAEARRIDIERGGSGKVTWPEATDEWCCFFHEETETWRERVKVGGSFNHGIFDSSFLVIKELWIPVTPEPEQKPNHLKTQFEYAYDKLNEEKEQLEKEIESLKANQKAPWRKCSEEKPRLHNKIIYSDSSYIGVFCPANQSWWVYAADRAYKLDKSFVCEFLSWKYVEEL